MSGLMLEQVTADQAEIVQLVSDVLPTLPDLEAAEEAGSWSDAVVEARLGLVESGLWSIGIDEDRGGGGASLDLRQIALAALGGAQPALAWALAQAEAAAEILALDDSMETELEAVVSGQQPAVILSRTDPQVHLVEHDGQLSGGIGRLDVCGDEPLVVVLDEGAAWVIQPGALRFGDAERTTGMAGAATVSAVITDGAGHITRVVSTGVNAIRARMQMGGAAIAAGLALAAAEAATSYSAERVQFGAPISALPTVRQSLARQNAAAVSALADALHDAVPGPARAAALLRENCERALSVTSDALLSHGGYGYLHEYGVERLVRDAVSLRAATGARAAFSRSADRFAPH